MPGGPSLVESLPFPPLPLYKFHLVCATLPYFLYVSDRYMKFGLFFLSKLIWPQVLGYRIWTQGLQK